MTKQTTRRSAIVWERKLPESVFLDTLYSNFNGLRDKECWWDTHKEEVLHRFDKGVAALKSGILILLIPTTILFGGLMWVTFQRRNSSYAQAGTFAEPGSEGSSEGLIPLAASEADRV